MKKSALFIVDVQNDFLPGGALAVPSGDRVIDPINRLQERFEMILASKDWHPAKTVHFDRWPVHCVRGTEGARFPSALKIDKIKQVFLKGTGESDDGYSAFEATNEDLEAYLKIHGIERLYITGLATDYCVKATALDAAAAGFETFIVRDAVRAVNLNPGDETKAMEIMQRAGVKIILSKDLNH